jgi:acyl-CoA thioester hydrolase
VVPEATEHERRKLLHAARIAVRWRDMDVNRHVNNVVYFRYLEQARIEWFDAALEQWREGTHGIVIADAHCTFLEPLVYPATIEVCVYAGPPGRSSFTFYYSIHPDADRSVRYAEGSTRVVWVDRGTGRPAPLPDYVRGLLA